MNFSPLNQALVLRGIKRQTRRPAKTVQSFSWRNRGDFTIFNGRVGDTSPMLLCHATISEIREENDRLKLQVGRNYAVGAGRGKGSLFWRPVPGGKFEHRVGLPEGLLDFFNWYPARFQLMKIRLERLQDITEADAIEEACILGGSLETGMGLGFDDHEGSGVELYKAVWEMIYGDGSWNSNPLVWALDIRIIIPWKGYDE